MFSGIKKVEIIFKKNFNGLFQNHAIELKKFITKLIN